jgi:hypothetical protein
MRWIGGDIGSEPDPIPNRDPAADGPLHVIRRIPASDDLRMAHGPRSPIPTTRCSLYCCPVSVLHSVCYDICDGSLLYSGSPFVISTGMVSY